MELMALYKGLDTISGHLYVVIESDPQASIEMMMGRVRKWARNRWKTLNGDTVKHQVLSE
jgi:ribonuclease HI